MRAALSPDQIASYRENGFLVIPDFLSPEELEEWRVALDEAVAARKGLKLPGRENLGKESEYYNNVFLQCMNLWKDSERMRRIVLDPRLAEMAGLLAGMEGNRLWQDQALIKQPWGNPTSWHLDAPYWSFTNADAITLWVALDDATLENGCLWFIPSTHQKKSFDNHPIGAEVAGIFKIHPEFAGMKSVSAPMKAGACSFHNGLTVHGAGANMTPGRRRAMTCAYYPDGAVFNGQRNILSDDQMARLKVGDPLNDDTQWPLLWSRKASAKAAPR